MKFCEVCNVKYASDAESVELHESGKRHIRLTASYRELQDIAQKSIYMKWPIKLEICFKDLEIEVAKFGSVSRFLHKEGTNYAIVEFQNPTSAQAALNASQIELSQGTISVLKRELQFNSDVEDKKINSKEIVEEAVKVPILNEDTYDGQITCIINHIVIPAEQMKLRQGHMDRLEVEMNKYFYGAKIKMFGSSITTIGTIDSDVDASLEFDTNTEFTDFKRDKYALLTGNAAFFSANKISQNEMKKLSLADQTRLLCKILNEIRKNVPWLGHQRPVLDARCPVVRFTMNKKLIVDLSCNNILGRAKSEYIRSLIEADQSGNLRKLLLAFRFWALTNDLFEPLPKQHKGQFNAYMLNLLVIYFLIQRKAVPAFSHSNVSTIHKSYRIDFEVQPYNLEGLHFPTFFKEFFLYMVDMKSESFVLVGFSQTPIPIDKFDGLAPESFKLGVLNVQDPLELGHNVCQNVCQKLLSRMRRRMTYSLGKLKHARHRFSDLLSLEENKVESKFPPLTVRLCGVDEKLDDKSEKRAREYVQALCEEILGFEIFTQPAKKRSKTIEHSYEEYENYGINAECWVGRRSMKKKVAEKYRAENGKEIVGFELEKEITRTILRETEFPDEHLGTAMVGMEQNGNDILWKIVPISGPDTLFNNITHFLETFVSNYERDVIRALTDQEPMEE
ncbi:unnamed protein product [Auanema sp. JU1783]|nr:unnamed protein product [Auanema sp. JU1783]